MADNQSFKQITADELEREIDDNLKSDTHDSKFNFNENSNFNSQLLNQTNLAQDKPKEGNYSITKTLLAVTTPSYHQLPSKINSTSTLILTKVPKSLTERSTTLTISLITNTICSITPRTILLSQRTISNTF
jgi:hypothetical protein